MAIYYLHMSNLSRGRGNKATSAAAYRAGERIRDERTGRLYNHSQRQDVMHKEIVLPGQEAGTAWAKDRSTLWNAAELAEPRNNARVAREYVVALPVELSHERRVDLVRAFSQELAERHRYAVDFAIHEPRSNSIADQRNYHAHLLATTREITAAGLGQKTTLDMNNESRHKLGLGPSVDELFLTRERWAAFTNTSLREAGIDVRIDHRSYRERGIERDSTRKISRDLYAMQVKGLGSAGAERNRDEYLAGVRERLAARAVELKPLTAAVGQVKDKPQTLEEIRSEAREAWLQYRHERAEKGLTISNDAPQVLDRSSVERSPASSRGTDDDFSM